MGMHFGILAARCAFSELLPALSPYHIREKGTLPEGATFPARNLVGGSHAGAAIVIDRELELSCSGDAVLALSEQLQTLVIACGAETASGSYWFFAAEKGALLRAVWICLSDLTADFDEGSWPPDFSSELDDPDALFEVLKRYGFDIDAFTRTGEKHLLSPAKIPEGGPIQTRIDAFCAADKEAADDPAFRAYVMKHRYREPLLESLWRRLRTWAGF